MYVLFDNCLESFLWINLANFTEKFNVENYQISINNVTYLFINLALGYENLFLQIYYLQTIILIVFLVVTFLNWMYRILLMSETMHASRIEV